MNELTTQDDRLIAIESTINSLYSPKSKRVYKMRLYEFLEWHNQEGRPPLTKSVITKYLSHILETKSAKVANQSLSILKTMIKEAEDNGLLNPYQSIGIDRIKRFKVSSEPVGRALPNNELELLLSLCDDTPIGIRNRVILYTMWLTGVRRTELVNLDLSDYKSDRLNIRHGKGNKDRHCYITDEIKEVMTGWLSIRGYSAGPLFTRIRKGNQLTLNRLTDQAVYYIVKDLQQAAGIEPITPHDFRRTFITNLLINKIPIDVVKDMAGHADISTTSRYNRQDKEEAMSEAVKVLRIGV